MTAILREPSNPRGPTGAADPLPAAPASGAPDLTDVGPTDVVPACPADLAYVVSLAKRHPFELGFVQRSALARKIELGRIDLALENGEPCGFIHHGSFANPRTPGEARVFQAAVQYDARRRHHGLNLVASFLAKAESAGVRGVSLRCLEALDANAFWAEAGFERGGVEPGAKGPLVVWRRRLGGPLDWSSRLHPCPACGDLTTDTWTPGPRRHRTCAACTRRALASNASNASKGGAA